MWKDKDILQNLINGTANIITLLMCHKDGCKYKDKTKASPPQSVRSLVKAIVETDSWSSNEDL